MKRHHAYYHLKSEEGFCHRFQIYSSQIDHLICSATWDGIGQLTEGGCSFGMRHGLPPEQPALPDQFRFLIPQLRQLFIKQAGDDLGNILIQYNGYTCKKTIECLIVLDSKPCIMGPEDIGPDEWSPWKEKSEFDQCFQEHLSFTIDEQGTCQLAQGNLVMCGKGTYAASLSAPTRVYDIRSTIPVLDENGKFLMENFKFYIYNNWRDSLLLPLVVQNKVLALQQYNEKYDIVPDVPLDIFEPSLLEWSQAISRLNVTERNLIDLLEQPETFKSNPVHWRLQNKQIGIARAFLRSSQECTGLMNRFIEWPEPHYPDIWSALVKLDPTFPYMISWSDAGVSPKLPSKVALDKPESFVWLLTEENFWLYSLIPKDLLLETRIFSLNATQPNFACGTIVSIADADHMKEILEEQFHHE